MFISKQLQYTADYPHGVPKNQEKTLSKKVKITRSSFKQVRIKKYIKPLASSILTNMSRVCLEISSDFNYYFGFVVEDCRAWARLGPPGQGLGIPENLDVSSPTRVEQLSYNNFYKNQKLNINWNPVRVFDICSER